MSAIGEVDVGGPVIAVVCGDGHTCALLDTGAVRCWGTGNRGQLGYGATEPVGVDAPPGAAGDIELGGLAVSIAAGSDHTCALLEGGAVRCWGSAAQGQLGYGDLEDIGDDEKPASAGDVSVGGNVVAISAGGNSTCVLLENGAVRCWGDGAFGQLGYGNLEDIGDDEEPSTAGNVPLF